MSLTEKIIECWNNEILYHFLFTLSHGPTSFIDDLTIEMKVENKEQDVVEYYSNNLKVFYSADGLGSITSIDTIERNENSYHIKFVLNKVIVETNLIEGNTMSTKTKASLIEECDKKINIVMKQMSELREMILVTREKSPKAKELRQSLGNKEGRNELVEKVISCEESIRIYEQIVGVMKDNTSNLEKRIDKLEKRMKELTETKKQTPEREKDVIDGLEKKINCCLKRDNELNQDIESLNKKVMSFTIDNEEKHNRIIDDIILLKNWSNQTEALLFGINQSLSNAVVSNPRLSKSKTETIIIARDEKDGQSNSLKTTPRSRGEPTDKQPKIEIRISTSGGGEIQGGDKTNCNLDPEKTPKLQEIDNKRTESRSEPQLSLSSTSDEHTPRPSKTPPISANNEEMKISTQPQPSLSSPKKKEEKPKRKQLHRTKKSQSMTLKEGIDSLQFDVVKSSESNPLVPNRVSSISQETAKSRSNGCLSAKPRPRAAVIDPDNLKEEFERKNAIKEKESIQTKSKNDLIFKELKEGRIMHLVCEEEGYQIIIKRWVEENIKSIDFWNNFDSELPKGIIIICKELREGSIMKNRLEMMFGEINIVLIGVEEKTEEGYIQICFKDGEIQDKDNKIKGLIKGWN